MDLIQSKQNKIGLNTMKRLTLCWDEKIPPPYCLWSGTSVFSRFQGLELNYRLFLGLEPAKLQTVSAPWALWSLACQTHLQVLGESASIPTLICVYLFYWFCFSEEPWLIKWESRKIKRTWVLTDTIELLNSSAPGVLTFELMVKWERAFFFLQLGFFLLSSCLETL